MRAVLTLALTAFSLASAVPALAADPPTSTIPTTAGAKTPEGYANAAALADMYEMQAGQIAKKRGEKPETRTLADMIIADHTASTAELKTIAMSKSISLPTQLDERRQTMIKALNEAAPAEFDDTYLDQQIMAHQEALQLHTMYSQVGDDEQLTALAQEVIPKIRMHLEHADELEDEEPSGMDPAPRASDPASD